MGFIKRKRDKPRRKRHPIRPPGEMENNRIKDTQARPMNAVESKHADRLVAMGCLIPGCARPACYHHERGKPLRRRIHMLGAPLCPYHHKDGPKARHNMDLDDFNDFYGIDIDRFAHDQRDLTLKMEGI